ncbi:MAG: hypothetical protein WCV71_04665 [Patescibacteria group bacterium]|jgi:hypothetical protein
MKKLVLFFGLLAALFACLGCEGEADTPMLPETPDSTSVDATVDNPYPQKGEVSYFHADVRGSYDELRWSYTDLNNPDPVSIGTGEDVDFELDFGRHLAMVEVFYQGASVDWDTVGVFVLPPDAVVPVTVTASAAVVHGPVPRWTGADADGQGGFGELDYYWRKGDAIIGYGESIDYHMTTVGPDTLWVFATDEIGQWDSNFVILTGEVDQTEVVTWSACPNIWVGPSDDFSRATTTVQVSGNYENGYLKIEWDALSAGHADAILAEILLPNEHRYAWRFDKPAAWGQKIVYYEVGDLNLQAGEVTLNLYWLGGDKSDKCTGRDTWRLVEANAEIPLDKSSDVLVVGLDYPNRDQYIRRQ